MKTILGVFGPSKDKSIYSEIRQLIKGKEEDPQKIIDLNAQVNAQEAQHRSIFVAGWRPFTGWICGVALGYTYIVYPFMVSLAAYNGVEADFPVLNTNELLPILFGMLGLGGLRTYEKLNNKTK
ncbi:MAG: holin family protein [Gammaproteobacteria bacterium]|nr:holin family protein [Gammaproteobacteria bacterium]